MKGKERRQRTYCIQKERNRRKGKEAEGKVQR